MLRSFITSFQRALILQSKFTSSKLPFNRNLLDPVQQYIALHNDRLLARVAIEPPDFTSPGRLISSEADGDYIAPYCTQNEYVVTKKALFKTLRLFYKMSNTEMEQIINHDSLKNKVIDGTKLPCIQLLHQEGLSKQSLIDYPWLIGIEKGVLLKKLELLKGLSASDINHFIAYMRLNLPRLKKLVKVLQNDSGVVPNSNRVYYISSKLRLDPCIVSKYLSHRLFILEMPFGHLERNLQNMIDYNVPCINILRDLWAFRYKPISVRGRLERAKRAKKHKIMPWMVRCPERILQRTLKLAQDDVKVFGEKNDVIEYVAGRLNFDVETTKGIMMKHKQVLRVRGTKIKEVLDYLLDEAGFSRYDIAQVPRILCHGLETTKQRLDELKSYGCRPSTLVILCRSKREYEKFVQAWLSTHRQDQSSQNLVVKDMSMNTEYFERRQK